MHAFIQRRRHRRPTRVWLRWWLALIVIGLSARVQAQGQYPPPVPPFVPPSNQTPQFAPPEYQGPPPAWMPPPVTQYQARAETPPYPPPAQAPIYPSPAAVPAEQPAPPPPTPTLPMEQWLQPAMPDSWMQLSLPKLPWEGSFQLGINGSAGNDESFSLQTGGDIKREVDSQIWKADFVYVRTTAKGVTTQHNAISNLKWEYLFESPWTVFTRLYSEYDDFKSFDLRLALNAGLGYRFLDTETTKLKGRFGAGWSREFGGDNDEYVPEAVFGTDVEHKISDRQKFTFTADYFPNWTEFADYRIVSNASWELLLDEASHLSLKLSAIDRYDSTPQGKQPNDLNYALLLMWKL